MVHLIFDDEKKSCTLTMDGDITIGHMTDVKPVFGEALARAERIVVNLDKIAETDLSFLQLLCSMHRASVSLHKHLTISPHVPESFKETAGKAGYLRSKGCAFDKEITCLWKM
jgi:ABC-type transporter Mla MlaB component